MTKPKYQIGDRFTVMETVICEIVNVIPGNSASEPEYIFQLFDNPLFKSRVTQTQLTQVIEAQRTCN